MYTASIESKEYDMWHETNNSRLPDDGRAVEVVDGGGRKQYLIYKSRLWWLPDMSMYVYYVPLRWRYV